tara:strand:- start:793 stop:1806 length:1014 start_codon:yes stop_codon:yes gene_type:complete
MFISCNRGKRSLSLNLKKPGSKEILWRLIEKADVLVENMRPGAMERLGFGKKLVKQRKPQLIYLSITGFGATGPYSNKRVYDPLIQAVSGLADLQGESIQPKMIRTVIADKTTAIYATQAITAALYHREKTGEGQHISIAMLDAMISFLWPEGMSPYTIVKEDGTLPPPSHDRIFETSDGHITAGAISDSEWRGMCVAMDRQDLISDERFVTQQLRNENKDQRYSVMAKIFKTRSSAEWLEALDKNDVPSAPVLRRSEMFLNPQIMNNEIICEIEQQGIGQVRQARPAAHFSKTPAVQPRSAPRLGEHSIEVLTEIEFTKDEINAYVDSNIVFQFPL